MQGCHLRPNQEPSFADAIPLAEDLKDLERSHFCQISTWVLTSCFGVFFKK